MTSSQLRQSSWNRREQTTSGKRFKIIPEALIPHPAETFKIRSPTNLMHHVRISMKEARGKFRTEFLLVQNNIYIHDYENVKPINYCYI